MESHYKENQHQELEDEDWLTADQIMDHYKSEAVTEQLISACEACLTRVEVRPHPKLPDFKPATQYLVPVKSGTRDMSAQVAKSGIKMQAELDEKDSTYVRKKVSISQNLFGGKSFGGEQSQSQSQWQSPAKQQRFDAFGREEPFDAASQTTHQGSQPPTPRSALELDPEDQGLKPSEWELQKKAQKRREDFEKREADREEKRLKRDEQKKEEKQKREDDKKDAKQKLDAMVKTPEGRAQIWLNGLQSYINKCSHEIKYCNGSEVGLPGNLAREYAALWAKKTSTLKRLRQSIEQALSTCEGEVSAEAAKEFRKKIDAAETALETFKNDMQRYKSLDNSYKRDKTKDKDGKAKDVKTKGLKVK